MVFPRIHETEAQDRHGSTSREPKATDRHPAPGPTPRGGPQVAHRPCPLPALHASQDERKTAAQPTAVLSFSRLYLRNARHVMRQRSKAASASRGTEPRLAKSPQAKISRALGPTARTSPACRHHFARRPAVCVRLYLEIILPGSSSSASFTGAFFSLIEKQSR
jgi:hypothetical protein